jgi:SAM-dependent methyltransferase
MTEVWQLYEQFAHRFDRERRRFIGEDAYLNEVLPRIDRKHPRILDLGCGSGHPIARYFIDRGCDVTGVDAAPAMITICRERFPRMTWIAHDMRALNLGRHFEAIVAWDSFFHLLLFTSGPKASEAIGDLFGRELYHASLDTDEYRSLLAENGFSVLIHRVEDPECDKHTVWLAQYKGGAASNGQPD